MKFIDQPDPADLTPAQLETCRAYGAVVHYGGTLFVTDAILYEEALALAQS